MGATITAISLAILDEGVAVYDLANGRIEVEQFLARTGKTVLGGTASWAAGNGTALASGMVGMAGAAPVVVAVVIGGATYLVIDWGIDQVEKAMQVAHLSADDVMRIWPQGQRGVQLTAILASHGAASYMNTTSSWAQMIGSKSAKGATAA